MESRKIGVIGGGSWATALVKLLCNNNDKIHWWMRNPKAVENLKQYNRNLNYLQSVQFNPEKIVPTTDLYEVTKNSNVIVAAIPSAFVFNSFNEFDSKGMEGKIIFSSIKGIVPEYHSIPARYFHKQFNIPYENIGIIAGPCHAEEVALERLSYLTVACQKEENANMMAELLACRYIKTSTSDDIFGTELSTVLKNIFAIAAGICHGLGYGDNFQAILMSNAIQEIERFVDKVNPIHRDVKSSAYLGDLLVTGYSQFSRNRTFGNMLGKGYSVTAAQMEMKMIAEGYYAAKSIHKMNERYKVEMPIADAVYRIIYEKVTPIIEMKLLEDKLR